MLRSLLLPRTGVNAGGEGEDYFPRKKRWRLRLRENNGKLNGIGTWVEPAPINAMRRVLATDFGIWPMLQKLERASDAMVSSTDYWSRLANYVLLYDQIVIPTGNLQVLPVLRLILGEGAFDDLVRSKGIVLARFDAWFGYGGNGAGLVFFRVQDGRHPPNLATAFFKPLDEAIAHALAFTNPPSTIERRSQITNLLIDNVITLPTDA